MGSIADSRESLTAFVLSRRSRSSRELIAPCSPIAAAAVPVTGPGLDQLRRLKIVRRRLSVNFMRRYADYVTFCMACRILSGGLILACDLLDCLVFVRRPFRTHVGMTYGVRGDRGTMVYLIS